MQTKSQSLQQKIKEIKAKYPKIMEEYNASIILSGTELFDHLLKTGSTEQQKQLNDIDFDKSYKISKTAIREVNIDRRIRQFQKEKRPEKFILIWLEKVVAANIKLLKNIKWQKLSSEQS